MVIDILLWLDDIRDPFEGNWIPDYAPEYVNSGEVFWVKSFSEFKEWIETNGLPTKIAFDHDLGEIIDERANDEKDRLIKKEAPSGYVAAKWLVEYCSDNDLKLSEFIIQSANPVGAENIRTYLNNAKKHLNL